MNPVLTMPIKHLVLSGGGPTGLLTYGAASFLAKSGFWQLSDIKTIYGCSIGAFIGVVLSLGYELEWLDDYFIKRPWGKVVASSSISLVDVFDQKCLLNENFFKDAISPLLKAKELAETITLSEFYAFNNIEIHMYSTNINTEILTQADISYKTHPNLSLITALRMTMAFPVIFQPIFEETGCYIDGGLLNNFPLNDCIEQTKCEPDEILAFKNIWNMKNTSINAESSIIDFVLTIMKKMQSSLDGERRQEEIKHTVRCLVEDLDEFSKWLETLSIETSRQQLVEKGYNHAKQFISNLKNKT